LTGIVLVKGCKIPENGGGRRDRAMLLLPPPPLLSREVFEFDPAEYAVKPLIRFQEAKIVNRLPSGEIEEDKAHDDLFIRPALDLRVEMGRDAFSQIKHGGEVEVDGEAGKGGHAACGLLFFVLVGKTPCAIIESPRW
jgi:hypothetical protein